MTIKSDKWIRKAQSDGMIERLKKIKLGLRMIKAR